jgi:FkbM family methyltransferase
MFLDRVRIGRGKSDSSWSLPRHISNGTARAIAGGTYEPEVGRAIARMLRPGATFVDVGANVGYFSVAAARLVGDAGSVWAFEPEPVNFSCLSANCRPFPSVAVLPQAVGAQVGAATLHVAACTGCHSLFPTKAWNTRRQLTVPVTTIDEFCAARGIGMLDVIKIDAEGAELLVVQGMSRMLSQRRVGAVVFEFRPAMLRASGCDADAIVAHLAPTFRLEALGVDGAGATPPPDEGLSATIARLRAAVAARGGAINVMGSRRVGDDDVAS